jgi:tetratricopeptide (TPR) repeat protein
MTRLLKVKSVLRYKLDEIGDSMRKGFFFFLGVILVMSFFGTPVWVSSASAQDAVQAVTPTDSSATTGSTPGIAPTTAVTPVPTDLAVLLTPVQTASTSESPKQAPSQATMDLFKKGLQAYQDKDFENAVPLLEKALASEELGTHGVETAQANAALGEIYQNHQKTEGHLDMARTYYMAALEADSSNETAKNGLAQMSAASAAGVTQKLPEPSAIEGGNGREAKIAGTGDYFRIGASLPGLGGNFDGNELGQLNGLAGGNIPYFFLPQVTSGYGFTGGIGRTFVGHFSAELNGFLSFLNSDITMDQAKDKRTYLNGNNVNPNLTALGVELRFLYELPLESSFKISPFVGLNYESISMTNVMIDQIDSVKYSVPTQYYTFGSYGTEAGLYLGYQLNEEFQVFVCGQLPVVTIFSNNPSYPPHVIGTGGSSGDLNTAYESLTVGLKVNFDSPVKAQE